MVVLQNSRNHTDNTGLGHFTEPSFPSIDHARASSALKDRRVLITGAGGSIGSALVECILAFNPSILNLLELSENNLFELERSLAKVDSRTRIESVLGNVADCRVLDALFSKHDFDLVFHTAAFKHVPLLESQPAAAIENNILGTYELASRAVQYGVGKLIMLSTDKAVNPTSVMGASKRAGEVILGSFSNPRSQMTSVRLCNVLDSRGSVVPCFEEQIRNRYPVTVTDPAATRFFISLESAVSLLIQSVWLGQGGDVLVPGLRDPVRIVDIAEYLIRFAHADQNVAPGIVFTGLRPGEKLHEQLFSSNEQPVATTTDNVRRFAAPTVSIGELERFISSMRSNLAKQDIPELVESVRHLVPEYDPGTLLSRLSNGSNNLVKAIS
jgi:FlaA1/EpsC-like NDP-sugar epimerase